MVGLHLGSTPESLGGVVASFGHVARTALSASVVISGTISELPSTLTDLGDRGVPLRHRPGKVIRMARVCFSEVGKWNVEDILDYPGFEKLTDEQMKELNTIRNLNLAGVPLTDAERGVLFPTTHELPEAA